METSLKTIISHNFGRFILRNTYLYKLYHPIYQIKVKEMVYLYVPACKNFSLPKIFIILRLSYIPTYLYDLKIMTSSFYTIIFFLKRDQNQEPYKNAVGKYSFSSAIVFGRRGS